MTPNVTVDPGGRWGHWVKEYAAASGKSLLEAFKSQCVLLGRELIKRTPPFSGKSIVKMLSSQGKVLKDGSVEDLSALMVGRRAVERDIRRVIYGFRGASINRNGRPGSFNGLRDWGVEQRCEGKRAVRVFATKTGDVYGVDEERFMPDASTDELRKIHESSRTKRGRVSAAGQRTRDIGRWKWMNVAITKEKNARDYIKERQYMVGQAKGGWLAGMYICGVKKVARWMDNHARAGTKDHDFNPKHPWLLFINKSKWASGGDTERILPKSIAGREKAMSRDVERLLKKKWGI